VSELKSKSPETAVNSDARVRALTKQVGDRVREERERRKLTRRDLSEASGISQRYLAAVETGQGNISIALLFRISEALQCNLASFLHQKDSKKSAADRIASLYGQASEVQRQAVDDLLMPRLVGNKARRIALIGLRGAGKSTLGELIGLRLSIPFIELNRQIEDETGMPVADILGLYGQDGYRSLEHKALRRVGDENDEVVLAVAGGIVSAPETFDFLLESFHTVWLRATPKEHMDRVRAQGDERPMAGNPRALDELKRILTDREARYARADATLDTSGKEIDQTLADLAGLILEHGFLD
jgi:XRE family aerobic/anaerobic benzoate catabolism transcriptional regulator